MINPAINLEIVPEIGRKNPIDLPPNPKTTADTDTDNHKILIATKLKESSILKVIQVR